MKKLTLLIAILFFSIQFVLAQHSISSNYTKNSISHDFDLNYNYQFKNNKFIFGTSFLLNQVWQNKPGQSEFHAFNIAERFGLKLGYQHQFPLKNNKTAFFVSFDTRYRYGQTRGLVLDSELTNPNLSYPLYPFAPYREFVSTKIHAFTSLVGGGIHTHLFSNIYLNGQVGVGFDALINTNKSSSRTNGQSFGAGPGLAYMASLGIEYKFPGKKELRTRKF